MSSNVTSKGQVTIPKPFRDRLGITTGTAVDFELAPDGTNAKLILTVAGATPSPSRFAALRGRASSGMSTDEIIAALGMLHLSIPHAALFMAGKAFQRYRALGRTRTTISPDVFIGAHAAITGLPLLTRDMHHYKTYFPTLNLISPAKF